MTQKKDYEAMSVFEQIKTGLEESLAHARGELTLKTTVLPVPPPPASAQAIASLRRRLKMSQSVFAATLNVSPKLVQSWEQGLRKPARGDLRLIQIISRQPQIVTDILASDGRRRAPSAAVRGRSREKKRASAA
jgi:putative transcriptional regulator